MRKLIAAAAIVVVGAGMGGTAFAGEVTGSGKGGPNKDGVPGAVVGAFTPDGHAHSICAFSGLDDGTESGDGVVPGVTQNWGQIPKEVRDEIALEGEHPGDACNGHTGFMAG
jgi:hypothetical protein